MSELTPEVEGRSLLEPRVEHARHFARAEQAAPTNEASHPEHLRVGTHPRGAPKTGKVKVALNASFVGAACSARAKCRACSTRGSSSERLSASLGTLLVLALSACHTPATPTPIGREKPDEATRRILTTKEFPFCQSSPVPLSGDSRRWCTISDEATTCPALREHCAVADKAAAEQESTPHEKRSFYERAADRVQKLLEGDSGGAMDHTDPSNLNLSAFQGISRVIWAILAFALALAIAWIVRQIIRHRGTRGDEVRPAAIPELGGLEFSSRALGEVPELLARARDESQRDVGRALAYLYAATLKHLEQLGLIRWERSTTNRGYVRAVRGKTSLDEPLSELVRVVEQNQFGLTAPPDRPLFDRLYQRIVALIPGALVLILTFQLTSCGDYGDPGLDGHAVFNELLKTQGITSRRLSVPLDKWTKKDPPVLIDGGRFPIDEGMLESISNAVDKGARVLLLVRSEQTFPGWPDVEIRGGNARTFHASPTWAAAMKLAPGINGILPSGREIVLDPDADDDEGPPPDVLLGRDGHPFAARWSSDDGEGELVVVADRDLFANAALAVPANATLALALAHEVVGSANELATAMLGFENAASSPEDSLVKAGLWPVVLQGLLALAVFFWARGAAFGLLRERAVRPRRAFSEHVAALGRQLLRGGGSRYAASLYAGYALDRIRRRAGGGTENRDPMALARALAVRLNRTEAELAELLKAAESYRQEPNAPASPKKDLALIRQLDLVVRALPGTAGADGRSLVRSAGATQTYTKSTTAGKDDAPTLETGTGSQ